MVEDMYEAPEIPEIRLTTYCGSGASSEVWLGVDRTGIRRAVRIIRKCRCPMLLEMERRAISLYREKAGSHSHLLPILYADETPEYLYSVTEPADNFCNSAYFYEPDTLAERICFRTETVASILSYLDAILEGVERLHSLNMAHRDLKPENILFVRNTLKIADPGLVAGSDSVPVGGTPGFRPSWNASGIECDIYAIGKLIYMLFTRESPVRFPEIPAACRLNRFFALNELALHCCEREPHLRFQSVSEIRCALRGIQKTHHL